MARKNRQRRQRARIIVPMRQEIADVPGTISPSVGSSPPKLHVISFGPETLYERTIDRVEELRSLKGVAPVMWLNITGVGDAEVFKSLGREFNLHQLALEDVVNIHQRPKAEDYDEQAYVVLKMPSGGDTLSLEQVSIFVGGNYVITVQQYPGDCLEPVRQRIRKARGRIRKAGADYLAYAVIDAIIDNYFPMVDNLNAHLEHLEEQIIVSPDEEAATEVHAVRHDLHTLRRILSPTREALGLLARGDTAPIGEETQKFLRDCQDHTAQLLDAVEACLELSSSLMELHLSGVSNRMNQVMKVLTLIATIFIPLSFIAGVWGMNFDRTSSPWNMPELEWYFGYPLALVLMLLTSLGFILFFRRRGWLGKQRKVDHERHYLK